MNGEWWHRTLLLVAVAVTSTTAQEYPIPYGAIEKIEAALPHTYIKEGEEQDETRASCACVYCSFLSQTSCRGSSPGKMSMVTHI